MRKILGDPEQAVIRGTFSLSFNRPRMDEFTGLFGNNPGGTVAGRRESQHRGGRVPARRGRRDVADAPPRDEPARTAAVRQDADVPDHGVAHGRQRHQRVRRRTSGFPTRRRGRSVSARSIGKDMAVDLRYTGNRQRTRGTRRTGTSRTSRRTASSMSSSWRRRTCRRTSPPAAAPRSPTRAPARARRRCRPTWRTSARVPTAQCRRRVEVHVDELHERDVREPARTSSTPNPYGAASTSSGPVRAARSGPNSFAAGLPTNFFVLNPLVDDANVTRNVRGSYYNSLTVEAASPFLARPARPGQLHLRVPLCGVDSAERLPPRLRVLPQHGDAAAHVQGALDVPGAGRPRPALRLEHERVAGRRPRRLGVVGHRPRAAEHRALPRRRSSA